MSETPVEHQPIIDKQRGEQPGSAEAGSRGPRSQSLETGGAFLRALAADLGAAASRLRPVLAARHRRPQPPPSYSSSESRVGRVVWRVSMVFLAVLLLCSGALSAAMLWVIFGNPLEPRRSDPSTPPLRAEAANDASLSRGGTVNAAKPSRPDVGPSAEASIPPAPSPAGATEPQKPAEETEAEAPIQPGPSSAGHAEPQKPAAETKAEAPIQPGPPSAGATEQQKPAAETNAEAQAGSNQPHPVPAAAQDRGPGAGQQEASATGTDQPAGMQCSADLCAARYKSFNAADCTYQPYGGGARSICELGGPSAAARPQPPRVATDSSSKATDTPLAAAAQPIAKSVAPDRAGPQCNRTLCAATYKSFNAADCTYEPYGGGARAICGLSKGPAEASQQASRPTDSIDSPGKAGDMPVAGMVQDQDIAGAASPDRAVPQCDRSRCAATYQSFHAADCTYQPEGGGPRRICEP